jgi:hypothetical protein
MKSIIALFVIVKNIKTFWELCGDGGVIGGSHSLYGQTTFKSGPDIPKLDIRRIADLRGPPRDAHAQGPPVID